MSEKKYILRKKKLIEIEKVPDKGQRKGNTYSRFVKNIKTEDDPALKKLK